MRGRYAITAAPLGSAFVRPRGHPFRPGPQFRPAEDTLGAVKEGGFRAKPE